MTDRKNPEDEALDGRGALWMLPSTFFLAANTLLIRAASENGNTARFGK